MTNETSPINKTERLYYDFTSTSPFTAAIQEIRPGNDSKTEIILDKTIFYPEGGGQPGDRGSINGVPLLDVCEKDGEILHIVTAENAGGLKPGNAELLLDCRRRRDFTQLHSGQHILSAVLKRITGASTVSMHLGDDICTIDVDTAEINDDVLTAAEDAIAVIIEENRPMIVHLCPPEDISAFNLRKLPPKGEDVLRIVEIPDCDMIACCGTHVKSSAEIGLLRVLGAEKYKGMTRVSFLAGHRLLLESRMLRHNAMLVSRALSVPLAETGRAVLDLIEKKTLSEKRLKDFEEKAILEKAEALLKKTADDPQIIIESYSDSDINELISIGRAAQKRTQAVLILASEPDLKFIALCSAKGFDLRTLLKNAFEARGGRGGGSPSFFQGSFPDKEAMEAFLGEIGNKNRNT